MFASLKKPVRYARLLAIYMIRIGLRVFYIFPVKKNRIYFSSDRGTAISCNPYYIYRYLNKKYPDKYECIWQYGGQQERKRIHCVKPGSIKDIYYLLTSRILISNDGFGSFIPKRKQQIFINTWHGGGAYKRSGVDFITDQHPADLQINRICGRQTDIFLSGCRKFSEVMSTAKMVPLNRFLETGMPRNDFLIRGTKADISGKVKKYFGIEKSKKIVLFAPTYRGEEHDATFESELDIAGCLRALEERFGGEWEFLMRKHHFVKNVNYGGVINASDYPDMQELLYATDVFITDYSSTIWDYSLTFKPGFLFAPDLKQYTKERSFYTDPDTWAFPVAESNAELQSLILAYDEKNAIEKIKKHHSILGIKETGNACAQMAEKIHSLTEK